MTHPDLIIHAPSEDLVDGQAPYDHVVVDVFAGDGGHPVRLVIRADAAVWLARVLLNPDSLPA
jgi:hypothetical protein